MGPAGDPTPRSRSLRLGERRVHVVEAGEGEPLVLLHGIAGSVASFRPVLAPLARTHRVVAIDLPGFGRSEPLDGAIRTSALADAVERTLDALAIRHASFLGQSLGGIVALRLAADRPERVRDVVAISAGYALAIPAEDDPARQGHVPGTLRLLAPASRDDARALLALVVGDPDRAANPLAIDEVYRAHTVSATACAGLVASFGRRDDALDDVLDRMRARVLIVAGERDRFTPAELTRRLAERIPGARLEIVAGVGHAPIAERPDVVLALCSAFLAQGVGS